MVNSNPSLISRLREQTNRSLENTSAHGIPRILKASGKFFTVFWLVFFLASLTSCTYFMVKNVVDYYQYEVITNINIMYDSKPEFPKITICSTALDNSFIRYCAFNSKVCQQSDVIRTSSNCFALNTGINQTGHWLEKWKSQEPGLDQGLVLVLLNRKWLNSTSKFDVYINNHSDAVDTNKAIKVGSGIGTSLVISRERKQHLGEPYKKCKRDHTFTYELHGTMITKTLPYYQNNCFKLCRYREVAIRCNIEEQLNNITDYFYTNSIDFENKFFILTKNCANLNKIKSEVDSIFRNQSEYGLCSQSCIPECESTIYSVKSYYYFDDFQPQYLASLYIYYEDYRFLSINEIPKTSPVDFFSVIGGLLGLFLGTSLFSFIEIFELITSLLYIIFDYYFN